MRNCYYRDYIVWETEIFIRFRQRKTREKPREFMKGFRKHAPLKKNLSGEIMRLV